jgi:hypothetical protein
MKSENDEKITRLLLSLICFTVYISFFSAVLASAFNTNLFHRLLG